MKHRLPRHTFSNVRLCIVLLFVLTSGLHAATVPSSWDFGTGTGKDDASEFTFVSPATGDTTLEPNSVRFTRPDDNGVATFGNLVEFSDLGGGNRKDFQSSLTFTFTEVDGQDFNRFSLQVLADSASTGDIEQTGVTAEFIFLSDGAIDMGLRVGTLGTRFASATWNGDTRETVEGRTVTFDLSGSYIGDDLFLDFSATDSNNHSQFLPTTMVSANDETFSEGIPEGTWFGMSSRMGALRTENTDMIVDFDTFAVIPEPGTLVMVGIAMASLLFFRRKK